MCVGMSMYACLCGEYKSGLSYNVVYHNNNTNDVIIIIVTS